VVPRDAFRRFTMSPNGRFLVSAAQNEVFVWNPDTFQLVGQWKCAHTIEGLAVSDDSRFIYVGETNGWLSVVELNPGAPPVHPTPPNPPPPTVALKDFFGDWQSVVIGQPEMTRRVFLYHSYKNVWHIFYTFQNGDKIVGAAHGEDALFADGRISFNLVYDQKPIADWPERIATKLHLENGALIETQVLDSKTVIRHVRPEVTAAQRALLGKWIARLSDGDLLTLDLLRPTKLEHFVGSMALAEANRPELRTQMKAVRPHGDGFAFEIDFPKAPEAPWNAFTRALLTPVGSDLKVELLAPGKSSMTFTASRKAKAPVVAKVAPIKKGPAAAPVRVEPPPAEQLAEALKTIQAQFAKEFAAAKKSSAERASLADKLFKLGRETMDDPAARYVLFSEARDLASQAGKWALAAEVLDSIRNEYTVDVLAQREAAMQMILKVSLPKDVAEDVAQAALVSSLESVTAERIGDAQRFMALATSAAAKSQSQAFVNQFKKHDQEMKAIVRDHEQMTKGMEILKIMVDDASAHLDVGRYLAVRQGDWERGLAHLVKGGDGELPSAARKDSENPQDIKLQQDVGNLWWNLAEKETGWARLALLGRAGHWYRQAANQAGGLTLTVLTDRIKIIDETPSPLRPIEGGLTMSEARRFRGHTGTVTGLFVAPDDKSVFSGSLDGTIRRWDLNSGKQISNFNALAPVLTFSFSPSQRFLASVGKDRLRVWNVGNPNKPALVPGPAEAVLPGAFWSDSDALFSTRPSGGYENFDYLGKRVLIRSPKFPVPGAPVAGDHGKSVFISLGDDVRFFRTTTGFGAGEPIPAPDASCAAFAPHGRWLLVGSSDKKIRQFELPSLRLIATFEGSQGVPRCLAFSKDSRRFACGGDDAILHLWDIDSPKEAARSPRHGGPIQTVAFTRDGQYVLSGGEDAVVHMWHLPRERK
jgi:hypothetical protein